MEWFDGCDNAQIIKQSDLNTQWLKQVSNTPNLNAELPIKHTSNVSVTDYDPYHTDNTVQYISDVFARDIEWLGMYRFPKVLYDV